MTYRRVLTRTELAAAVGPWTGQSPGVDIETNGKEPHEPDSRIVGVSLAGRGHLAAPGQTEGIYIPLAHQKGQNADPSILPELAAYLTSRSFIPYYLPFECSWLLTKWGIRLRVSSDAYVAGRLLHLHEGGLKDNVKKHLGRDAVRIEACLPPGCYDFSQADADDPLVLQYTCDDAINAVDLAEVFDVRVHAANLTGVYKMELQAASVMAWQSARGYEFDAAVYVDELLAEKKRLLTLEEEIFAELQSKPFSLNSPAQLDKVMQNLGIASILQTASGAPSWGKAALTLVADRHPAIPKIIAWKSSFAVVNTLSGKAATAVALDGKVHPRWNPMGLTGSARFNCEKPPMPTLPAAMRRAFVAPAGQRWIKLQWRQPEIRMLARLAECYPFAKFVTEQRDPHATLATLWGVTREQAKALAYTWVKSAGDIGKVFEASKHMGRPEDSRARVAGEVDAFFKEYSKLQVYLRKTAEIGASSYHIRGWLNRRYKCEDDTAEERYTEACEAVLSQSVATALKVALCKVTGLQELFSTPQAQGTREAFLLGSMRQFTPCYDTLYYTVDIDVPVAAHLALVTRAFQINLLDGDGGEFYMPCDVGIGPSWGTIQMVEDTSTVQELADSQVT